VEWVAAAAVAAAATAAKSDDVVRRSCHRRCTPEERSPVKRINVVGEVRVW
jgi:hypothetical protein